jgi:hypothetical protein
LLSGLLETPIEVDDTCLLELELWVLNDAEEELVEHLMHIGVVEAVPCVVVEVG